MKFGGVYFLAAVLLTVTLTVAASDAVNGSWTEEIERAPPGLGMGELKCEDWQSASMNEHGQMLVTNIHRCKEMARCGPPCLSHVGQMVECHGNVAPCGGQLGWATLGSMESTVGYYQFGTFYPSGVKTFLAVKTQFGNVRLDLDGLARRQAVALAVFCSAPVMCAPSPAANSQPAE